VLLHSDVVAVVRDGRRPEAETGLDLAREPPRPGRGHEAAAHVVHQGPAGEVEVLGRGGTRDIAVEWANVMRLGAEGQATHCGMQSIRSDDHAKSTWAGLLEGDGDSVVVLFQPGDRVVEQVLGPRQGSLVQQAAKVTAQYLDLGDDSLTAEGVRRQPGGDTAG